MMHCRSSNPGWEIELRICAQHYLFLVYDALLDDHALLMCLQ
jgi:hypothetical protein